MAATSEVAEWRGVHVVNFSLVTLAQWEKHEHDADQTAAIVTDLIDTCVAVLEAPVSATSDIQ